MSNPLSSEEDSSEEDNNSDEDSLDSNNSNSTMATTSKSAKAKSTAAATKKGKTIAELEDSPPAKRTKATKPPPLYNINTTKPYTANEYPTDDHDVIDLVLHEGGCPTANA